MTNKVREWVTQLTREGVYGERNSSPERIASHVQRGWSFLGESQESHDHGKREIIELVKELRK